jgi:ATP-dependent DNA helicase DinG
MSTDLDLLIETPELPDEDINVQDTLPGTALSVAEVLGPNGLLAREIAGYEQRPQQLAMADLVARAIAQPATVIVEAGTGVGKSFGYLVPVILSGHRAIVATANKTLQSQLIDKDLPFLQRVMGEAGYPFSFVVAKGKSNYVCLAKRKRWPLRFVAWAEGTDTGDVDEAPWVPEPEEQRNLCAGDDCTSTKCPHCGECFYVRARLRRWDADIVVTNHAQLCVQVENPHAQILPEMPVCIVDEAHQLEGYAMAGQSSEVSPWSFRGPAAPFTNEGLALLEAVAKDRVDDRTQDALIEPTVTFPEGLALAQRIRLSAGDIAEQGEFELDEAEEAGYDHDLAQAAADAQLLHNLADRIQALCSATTEGAVRHIALRKGALVGQVTQFDVSETLARVPAMFHTTVYCSATLATDRGFDYFQDRNGIGSDYRRVHTLQLGSPFDYQRQCLLYLPMDHGMPDPRHKTRAAFDRAVQRQMWMLVNASEGGALLLFTSYQAMHAAANTLRDHLDYPVRRQGEAPKSDLIAWLKSEPGAVLCATASFWEGVDVPGDALRLVAIDKIPFDAPGPVEQARQDAVGPRAFHQLVVPEATLRLKQGFGRLIRTSSDRGVVALLDPRLWAERYGQGIVEALPDARVVTSIDDVRGFYGKRAERAA